MSIRQREAPVSGGFGSVCAGRTEPMSPPVRVEPGWRWVRLGLRPGNRADVTADSARTLGRQR